MRMLAPAVLLVASCSASQDAKERPGGKEHGPSPAPPMAAEIVFLAPESSGITVRGPNSPGTTKVGPVPVAIPALGQPAPAPRRDADLFRQSCAGNEPRLARLRRYGASYSGSGEARIARAAWRSMPQEDRSQAIWGLAYQASCAAGRRMMVKVRILDERSRLLLEQPVSTELQCRGDGIFPPSTPWYPC